MTVITNPTAEQVEAFCDGMKVALLDALKRGSNVEIGVRQKTQAVRSPEYGSMVIDVSYVGADFKAKFRERGF